jgi:threonine/homoserine/homoserine lactone efflux protein
MWTGTMRYVNFIDLKLVLNWGEPMSAAFSPEFLLTSLVIVVSPGTGALYTIAMGLGRGSKMAIIAAFACTLGIVPHLLAALMGLAALLHTSALLFDLVKYAGVAYLLFMAWQTFKDSGALSVEGHSTPISATRVILDGVLLNVLNPKLTIFFVAFLPQFIAADHVTPLTEMIILSAIFMAMTFVVFALYGMFAASMRDHVISKPKVLEWMRRLFALAFVALAARLALQEKT